jgi:YidC/Oxa1 family membrane protein insertase
MFELYNELIYRPLLNLLVFFYNDLPGHDMGMVIIFLTLVIRAVLAPLSHKQIKSQKAMQDLQPKLTEVREKFKNDKEGQSKAMMALYKEHKINPLSSCLPLLVQFPLLIALYQVFSKALNGNLGGLYPFIRNPGVLDPFFFNFINLAKPSLVFGIIAGLLQFWQSKQMQAQNKPTDATAKAMNFQMTYVLPLFSIFIALKLPAGLPLYWSVTTLFAIAQQYYIMRKVTPKHKN